MSTSEWAAPYHRGNLRESLVEAALVLLRQGGKEALSLRATAKQAGVSAMAPYRHFADKEALMAAVAARGFARLAAVLRAADLDPDPAQALIAQGVAYVRFACVETALFRLMFGGAKPQGHPDLLESGNTAHDILARRVEALAPPSQREDITLACWSLVHGLACLLIDGQIPGGGADLGDMLSNRVTRLLVGAIRDRF